MINPFEARETYIYITKAALFRKIQQLNSLRQLTEIFFFVFFVCFFFARYTENKHFFSDFHCLLLRQNMSSK